MAQRRVIWKYPLNLGMTALELPGESYVLAVQAQNDQLTLWASVNPDGNMETRAFIVRGTGEEYEDNEDDGEWHVATVQLGPFVWHVFEVEVK